MFLANNQFKTKDIYMDAPIPPSKPLHPSQAKDPNPHIYS